MNQKHYFCKDSYKTFCDLNSNALSELFIRDEKTSLVVNHLETYASARLQLDGLTGSSRSFVLAAVYNNLQTNHLVILPDKESAAYFLNDLESIFGEKDSGYHKKKVLFYPSSYKKTYNLQDQDSTNILMRTEVLKRLSSGKRKAL